MGESNKVAFILRKGSLGSETDARPGRSYTGGAETPRFVCQTSDFEAVWLDSCAEYDILKQMRPELPDILLA